MSSCFILKIHGHPLPLLCFYLFPCYLPPVSPFALSRVSYLLWSICGFWVIYILFPPDVCFFLCERRSPVTLEFHFLCYFKLCAVFIRDVEICFCARKKWSIFDAVAKHFTTGGGREWVATISYYSSQVSLFWLQEETKKTHVSEKTAKQQQIWPNKLLSALGGLTVESRAAESQAAAFCKLISCRVWFPPTNKWFMEYFFVICFLFSFFCRNSGVTTSIKSSYLKKKS